MKQTVADVDRQLRLIDDIADDADERAISPDEAFLISNTARQALDDGSAAEAAWYGEYKALRDGGWPWRVAVFISWSATPTGKRWPHTQAELASEVLGLNSDRVIRMWREKNPAIDEAIAMLKASPLLKHRQAVLQALVDVATQVDHKSHPDRKLFLQMTGDVAQDGDVHLRLGGLKDLSELSDSELDEQARKLESGE